MLPLRLHGPRLLIRKAHPLDAEASFRWFADPRVTRYLPLAGKGFLPMENVVAFLKEASISVRPELAMGIEFHDGTLVGCGGFRGIVEGKSAELSLILGEPDRWGQGYGEVALGLMLDYGFGEMGLQEIWLVVRKDNAAGLRLFQGAGFRVLEEKDILVEIDGEKVVKHRMSLFKDSTSSF